jgi:hypothetical protein
MQDLLSERLFGLQVSLLVLVLQDQIGLEEDDALGLADLDTGCCLVHPK